MTIATKGGFPLVVGGRAATNCGCCQPPCPCRNNAGLPRNVHSAFAPGWACAPGHEPPNQITVEVQHSGESISYWSVSGDANTLRSATRATATAPSGTFRFTLIRRIETNGPCRYVSPLAVFSTGVRIEGDITINPGWLINNGWDAILTAPFNRFGFYDHDVLGITTTYEPSIPWADFDVGPEGNQLCSPDCVLSQTKSSSLFGNYRYSLSPLPLLEPNANLVGFQWAFCYSENTAYKTGQNSYAVESRCLNLAIISVV